MARTIKEIKKGMTDQFMADPILREKYGLSAEDTFEGSFSAVSFESMIFGIMAAAIYALEAIFDAFRRDVDKKIADAVVATIPWYHKICLEYQHGDAMILNESTYEYVYEVVDDSKKIIKYAACRDRGGGVYILVAGMGEDGYPKALSNDVLTAFREYVSRRKPAGVITDVFSYDPDDIKLQIRVQYDPMLINSDGSLIADPSVYPVEVAINNYLASILYGGTFNRNKLIDAVQSVEGVKDLILGEVNVKTANAQAYTTVEGNNYTSVGGSFKSAELRNTLSYVLEI